MPEELATQVAIQHLNLNTNELTSVPASLFTLENLKFLDISHNKIGNPKVQGSYLSEAIGQARALVEFRLAGNMLTEIPKGIGELENLEVLDLKDNRL